MHSDDSTLLFVKNGAITYAMVEQETDVGHPFIYSRIIAYERGDRLCRRITLKLKLVEQMLKHRDWLI